MMLAVDVDYRDFRGHVAGVVFNNWTDVEPLHIFSCTVDNIAPYQAGHFYRRELPCILQLLKQYTLAPDTIVVDGYVYLDGREQPGLGKHLFDALNGGCIVIGVAKEPYKKISRQYALCRALSQNPLYVTAAGVDVEEAKDLIASMHGDFRIPTLLKLADRSCRAWSGIDSANS